MSEEILQQIIKVTSVIAVDAFTSYYANYRLKMYELNYLQLI